MSEEKKRIVIHFGTEVITLDVSDPKETIERIKAQRSGWIEIADHTINLDNVTYVYVKKPVRVLPKPRSL